MQAFPDGAYRWGENNTDGTYKIEPCESYTDSNGVFQERPGKWLNTIYHFDNIFSGEI